LAIDDDSDVRLSIELSLGRDHDLILLPEADELDQVVEDYQPDLILLDIMMPGVNGLEACRKLKAVADTRNVPVIFITALTDNGTFWKSLEAGGDSFLTKPFTPKVLRARIRYLLGTGRGRRGARTDEEPF